LSAYLPLLETSERLSKTSHLRKYTTMWYINALTELLGSMDKKEFSSARTRLGKTQAQMAELLGSSPKAIQSYEQGWRPIPAHAERQLLLLLSLQQNRKGRKSCWTVRKCSSEKRLSCPAWEFKAGRLCWFINGTMCEGKAQRDWQAKMKICRSCAVMVSLLERGEER